MHESFSMSDSRKPDQRFWSREICGEWLVLDKSNKKILLMDSLGKHLFDQAVSGKNTERIVREAAGIFTDHIRIKQELAKIESYLCESAQNKCHCVFVSEGQKIRGEFDLQSAPNNICTMEITTSCNLDCSGCLLGSRRNSGQVMACEEFEAWMHVCSDTGIQELILTGGEPLLHPDLTHFVKLSAFFFSHVRILTNGLLINPDLLFLFQELGVNLQITYHFPGQTNHKARGQIIRECIEILGHDSVSVAIVVDRNSSGVLEEAVKHISLLGCSRILITFLESAEEFTKPISLAVPSFQDRMNVGRFVLEWNATHPETKLIVSGGAFRPMDYFMTGQTPPAPACFEILGETGILADNSLVPCSRWDMPGKCGLVTRDAPGFDLEGNRCIGFFTPSAQCRVCGFKAYCVMGCIEKSFLPKKAACS